MFCEFCGSGSECGVCGRGREVNPANEYHCGPVDAEGVPAPVASVSVRLGCTVVRMPFVGRVVVKGKYATADAVRAAIRRGVCYSAVAYN